MYYLHFCIAALTTVAKAYNITWSGFSQQKSQLNRFELKSVLLGLAKLRGENDLIYPNNFSYFYKFPYHDSCVFTLVYLPKKDACLLRILLKESSAFLITLMLKRDTISLIISFVSCRRSASAV